jgi:hypothetical protein
MRKVNLLAFGLVVAAGLACHAPDVHAKPRNCAAAGEYLSNHSPETSATWWVVWAWYASAC